MIVKIKYEDTTAFTSKDLQESLSHIFGNNIDYEVEPSDKSPESLIHFGLNELIAHKVLDVYFNSGEYDRKIKLERIEKDTQNLLELILSQLIQEIITRLEEE